MINGYRRQSVRAKGAQGLGSTGLGSTGLWLHRDYSRGRYAISRVRDGVRLRHIATAFAFLYEAW